MDFENFLNSEIKENQVGIVWLNKYSSILLKTRENLILFDPMGISNDILAKLNITILIISHEHFDHLDRANLSYILSKQLPHVLATPPPSRWARGFIKDQKFLHVVKPGDTLNLNNITIEIFPGNHPCGVPATFLIKTEDDIRIYHAIDSTIFDDMKKLQSRNIDIAILPIGIAPGTSPSIAKEMTKIIKPRIVIPHHAVEGFLEFKELVEKEIADVSVAILKQMEPYIYKKE
ncbi:MAG: MBL fold metallo-hydrolase [Candidatus Asgardarchaeia archaeon]|nr:MBL fold metallo-hydrolase [Candidatus Odinarchaeota archaeon]